MKSMVLTVMATISLAAAIYADEPSQGAPAQPKLPPASAEFERLKSLVGKWHGKVDIGQGPVDMDVQYRLIAGGTTVEERCFVGTPQEMVTMYYDRDGKLALTHYCIMGNRPGMTFKSADEKTIKFAFDENCGLNPRKSHTCTR